MKGRVVVEVFFPRNHPDFHRMLGEWIDSHSWYSVQWMGDRLRVKLRETRKASSDR